MKTPSARFSNSPSGIARVEVSAGADEAAFAAPDASGEDQPMAPVPFDLSLLDNEPAVASADSEPQADIAPISAEPAIAADAPAEPVTPEPSASPVPAE
jgi:two-component system chemotaxis sensor kinase CheA